MNLGELSPPDLEGAASRDGPCKTQRGDAGRIPRTGWRLFPIPRRSLLNRTRPRSDRRSSSAAATDVAHVFRDSARTAYPGQVALRPPSKHHCVRPRGSEADRGDREGGIEHGLGGAAHGLPCRDHQLRLTRRLHRLPRQLLYGASKAAVVMLVKELALELGPARSPRQRDRTRLGKHPRERRPLIGWVPPLSTSHSTESPNRPRSPAGSPSLDRPMQPS